MSKSRSCVLALAAVGLLALAPAIAMAAPDLPRVAETRNAPQLRARSEEIDEHHHLAGTWPLSP